MEKFALSENKLRIKKVRVYIKQSGKISFPKDDFLLNF